MPSASQFLGVERAGGLGGVDRFVHQRLGERRLIGLVVAVAAVADDVEHDVAAEFHAIFGGHARAEDHRLRIVAVDVQDRRLDRFRDVGAIEAGIGVRRDGGEADLVVDDEMDGSAGAVADQLAHRQGFIHQALAGKSSVAVHQDRHHRATFLGVACPVLAGTHFADDDGVDRLEVGRVGLQRQVHAMAGDIHVRGGAEVVLHVTGALHVVRLEAFAAELAEQRRQRLLDDVDQGVEAAAMGHADRDLDHAVGSGGLDHRVQRGNGDFAALQAEALGGDIALLAEHLEALGFG